MNARVKFQLTSLEIKGIIQQLQQRVNLKEVEPKYLRKKIDQVWPGYTLTLPRGFVGNLLYRGISYKEEQKPKVIKDLSYPPIDRIKRYGRANFPKMPMFYCSGDFRTPFFELGVKPGNTIVISLWQITHEFSAIPIGYSAEVFKKYNSNRTHRQIVPDSHKHPNQFQPYNCLIENFFTQEFTRYVPSEEEDHLYKLSAVIAGKLLEIQPGECGLVYPTMAMRANAENLALSPKYVDQHLRLECVIWARVDEYKDFSVAFTPLDFSTVFSDQGQIEWSKEGEYRICIEGKEYLFRKSQSMII